MSKDKKRSSEIASILVTDVNKALGEEAAHEKLIIDGSPSDVKTFISTGSTLLDYCIANRRNGGIPVSKITTISGLEGTGKTLMAMQICANGQKQGGLVVYLDTENALNTDFAMRVGLDTENNFVYINPSSVEDAFTCIYSICHKMDQLEKSDKSNKYPFIVIVWDSVAATPTKQDVQDENPNPSATVGLKPRILSKNISTLLNQTTRKNVALVFINQLRANINSGPFADPWIEPGGKSIPYASSARVRLINKGKVKVSDEVVGIQASSKVLKTRFGPPYRDCEFPIYFTKGIDDAESIIEFLSDKGDIKTKSGGPKGTQYYLRAESADSAVSKIEMKKRYKNEPAFKEKLQDLVEKHMTRILEEPDEQEIVIEAGPNES